MFNPISNVTSPMAVHRNGTVPIYKVEGFDGYDFASLGVTDQFLENAEVYYDKYTNPDHFNALYKIGLEKIEVPNREISVLDVGTGGGNSIFAIFDILGKDRVRALGVDISPQLLEICGKFGESRYHLNEQSLSLLCADLYDLHVKPGSMDLVTGSSILHHMLDPQPIVELAVHSLRPGGSAIFTEPFEDGYALLRMAYANIIEQSEERGSPLAEDFQTFMREFSQDFDARRGIGEIRDYTQYLDDKWYFTRSWFYDLGRSLNCDVQITPTHGYQPNIFWNQVVTHARLHNGADASALPGWAQSIIKRLDETFSAAQKRDFAFTAIVTFTRR